MKIEVPVRLQLRIDWSELDLLDHVNNVSYFKYMQAARINCWEILGMKNLNKEMTEGPMLASTTCKFLRPLFYPGNIIVETQISFIKNSSFGIHHRIFDESNEIAAEGDDVVVMFNFSKNEKINISEELRKLLDGFLVKP